MGPPGPPGVVGPQVSFPLATIVPTGEIKLSMRHSLHEPLSSPNIPRDPQERLAPWESAATLDHQDPPESRDSLVPQERKAPKETQDHLEALAKMDPQD